MMRPLVPTLALLAASSLATAADVAIDPKLEIHGFLSQGYVRSETNDYLGESHDGSFNLTEAAVNFGYQANDRLRIAVQLYAQDFYNAGTNEKVTLDLAFGQYTVNDFLGIRLGRIKQPFGLYNETLDVDIARTAAILPQSVYDLRSREYYFAVNGAGIFGSVNLKKFGSLDYQGFIGGASVPDDGTVANQYATDNIELNDITVERIQGAQLTWNTPLEDFGLGNLRLGGSYRETKGLLAEASLPNDISAGPAGTILAGDLDVTQDKQREFCLSLEYTLSDFTFQGEYYRKRTTQSYTPLQLDLPGPAPIVPFVLSDSEIDSEGWYVMADYRVNDYLIVGGYASIWANDFHDKNGDDRNDYQHDYAGTLRFDINDWWIIKLEGHYVHGTALLDVPDKQDDYFNDTPTTKENWWYAVVKTTFSF